MSKKVRLMLNPSYVHKCSYSENQNRCSTLIWDLLARVTFADHFGGKGSDEWSLCLHRFPANKSATMSEGSRRQLDVIQLHVDHILKYSKNGNDPVVEAEKFLDSLRLPTEIRSLVRTEKPMSLEECARKHEAVLIARYGDAKPMI